MPKPSSAIRPLRVAFVALATLVATADVRAAMPSDIAEAMVSRHLQQAPLALSGDGRWRVHVDPSGVLHRVELATGREAGHAALPPGALRLAPSGDARRVLVGTSGGCVARVDLDRPEAARVSWLVPDDSGALDATSGWHDAPSDTCGNDAAAMRSDEGLALSPDGRLAAIGATVVDLESRRPVARLPRAPYWSTFADGGTRWLAAGVVDNARDEEASPPNESWSASWDLRLGVLDQLGLLGRSTSDQGLLDTGWTPGTDDWHDLAGLSRGAVHVRTLSRSDCTATPRALRWSPPGSLRAPLAWDPLGRWVAVMVGDRDTLHDQLVVYDLASGRQLMHRRFGHELHGLVPSPDGTHLMGIVAPLPAAASDRPTPVTSAETGSVLVLDVPVGAATPASPRVSPAAASCERPAGAIAAQQVAHPRRALTLAWSVTLPASTPTAGGSAIRPQASILRRNDGSLWLDRGADLARLDPDSGRVVETLPTPRSEDVRSIVTAGTPAEGFVNAQGDTVTWRPLDDALGKTRRRIDSRSGSRVVAMREAGPSLAVLWVPKAGPDPMHPPGPWRVATYDLATGRLQSTKTVESGGDFESALQQVLPTDDGRPTTPACAAPRRAPAARHDWRIDSFAGTTAFVCGADGSARLSLWADVDATDLWLLAVDDHLAVTRDAAGVLHVLDAAAHADLGRVPPRPGDQGSLQVVATPPPPVDVAVVSATSRILLVQRPPASVDGAVPRIVVDAYRLP